jgi:hypothetical protein
VLCKKKYNFVDKIKCRTEAAIVKVKRICVRTSILEEKANACNVLLTCVEVLKEHFFPWAKKVTDFILSLFLFYFSSFEKVNIYLSLRHFYYIMMKC